MPFKAMSTWTDVPLYFCEKESYLSRLTFINVAFLYMQHNLFSPMCAFIIFAQEFINLYGVLVLLKC